MAKRTQRRQVQDYLDEKYGSDSRKLIEEYEKIAFGTASYKLTKPSKVDGLYIEETIVPDFATRAHAIEVLIAYQQGRPRQQIEVSRDTSPRKWNPDLLSLPELEQLERLVAKAQPDDAEVVEGSATPLLEKTNK